MADWAAMESAACHGIACAARAGDDSLRLTALQQLAVARLFLGDVDAGRAMALEGLAETRRLGLRRVEAGMLNVLAIAAGMQEDLVALLDLTHQNLQACRDTGDRVNEAIALSNLGGSWMSLGDLVQARRDLDAALLLLRANGDRVVEGGALATLSTLALWQGDATRALALAQQGLDVATAAQARDMSMLAGLSLGNAELALGRTAAARQAYTQARARALEIDDPTQHNTSAGLARVALAEGDTAAAVAALRPVLALAAADAALDGTEYPRLIELTCHQVLTLAHDPRADEWLARAHTALAAQADAITDPALRRRFLDDIPHHREIVAAWAARDAVGASRAEHPG
jgi:tetratricopeptide (TPR) repeat protein